MEYHPKEMGASESQAFLTNLVYSMQKAGCHTFHHSIATHLLKAGADVRQVHQLSGYKDVKTRITYTDVFNHLQGST